jgi:uncharacterized Zn-binding protein involved in type VI secretion
VSRPLIVVGDKTDHGGEVIQGSPTTDAAGKPIARVGDKITCPRHGGIDGTTVIATGDPTLIIDGQPAARHGDKTACGATLLATQVVTTDDPGGGGGSTQRSSRATPIAAAAAAAAGAAATMEKFDLHFLVKDEKSGSPMANVPYRLTLETGSEVIGVTDSKGLTKTIDADSAVIAKLEVPYYGDSSSSAHTNNEYSACGH